MSALVAGDCTNGGGTPLAAQSVVQNNPRLRSGRPRHLECSGHAWTTRDKFDDFPFSKADLEIIRALRALPQPPRLRELFTQK